MKIEYSIATDQDFLDLAKLRYDFKENSKDINLDFIDEYTEYLKTEYQLGRLQVFIACSGRRIVANMNLIIIPKSPKPGSNHSKSIGYLTNCYTVHEFRNQNIGSMLLQNISDYAAQNSIELLFVWPSERATTFYQRAGFNHQNEIMEKLINE
jgi:ribosomal protein S18 acetylase RimI-like enzyme